MQIKTPSQKFKILKTAKGAVLQANLSLGQRLRLQPKTLLSIKGGRNHLLDRFPSPVRITGFSQLKFDGIEAQSADISLLVGNTHSSDIALLPMKKEIDFVLRAESLMALSDDVQLIQADQTLLDGFCKATLKSVELGHQESEYPMIALSLPGSGLATVLLDSDHLVVDPANVVAFQDGLTIRAEPMDSLPVLKSRIIQRVESMEKAGLPFRSLFKSMLFQFLQVANAMYRPIRNLCVGSRLMSRFSGNGIILLKVGP